PCPAPAAGRGFVVSDLARSPRHRRRAELCSRQQEGREQRSGGLCGTDRRCDENLASMHLWPGRPYPLGATFDGSGTNFALFSSVAERVELCLLDEDGTEKRLELTELDGHVWHGYLREAQPGQRYGYRVHGPYEPEQGHRCDPSKLLLDP